MAFERLDFTCSWEDPADFPTYEPNEGKVRADLQRLHNETRDGFNRLVAALNAPTASESLPFRGEGLQAENVRDAIVETYEAVREASAGLIVDGAVTKEKLDPALLERVYGGSTWMSMDTPGTGQNPDSGFPVGQLWLRPAFTVENKAGTAWQTMGCTASGQTDGVRFTGNGQLAEFSAVQTLWGIGRAGARVHVLAEAVCTDPELTGLTVQLGGELHNLRQKDFFEAILDQSGSLTMTIRARWPAAALAVGEVQLRRCTVVNSEAVEEALPDCRRLSDWRELLVQLGDFRTAALPRTLFCQTASGVWAQVDTEVLPVHRGGTGLSQLRPGQLLYADADGCLTALDGEAGSVLCFDQGKPRWSARAQLLSDMGGLSMAEGSYAGTAAARTLTLPRTPKLLVIYGSDLTAPAVLTQASSSQISLYSGNGTGPLYTTGVSLSGAKLTFWMKAGSVAMEAGATAHFCNQSGVTYRWLAIV